MKQKGFAQLILVLLLLVAVFAGTIVVFIFQSRNSRTTSSSNSISTFPFAANNQSKVATIKLIKYNNDCTVNITLNSDEKMSIDVTKDEKTCSNISSPTISPDRKYGAFELRILEKDSTMISGKVANNAIFVYFADQKNWANVYQFGAAWVKEMDFDQNDNLLLTVTNDEITDERKILLPLIEGKFTMVVDPLTKKINYSESFLPDDVLKTQ